MLHEALPGTHTASSWAAALTALSACSLKLLLASQLAAPGLRPLPRSRDGECMLRKSSGLCCRLKGLGDCCKTGELCS
jgi:hypothetical protein